MFSNWWIGSVNSLPWPLDSTNILVIYIILTVAYGLLELVTGFFSPLVSVVTSRTIN